MRRVYVGKNCVIGNKSNTNCDVDVIHVIDIFP